MYFNDGAGRFVRVPIGESEADTYGVAIGYLDGDGYPDVVFAKAGSVNEVYLNSKR